MPELAPVASTLVAPTSVAPLAAASAASTAPNRRQLLRLRDLCDEVLASFRVARERDVISDLERQDARAVLAALSPRRG